MGLSRPREVGVMGAISEEVSKGSEDAVGLVLCERNGEEEA